MEDAGDRRFHLTELKCRIAGCFRVNGEADDIRNIAARAQERSDGRSYNQKWQCDCCRKIYTTRGHGLKETSVSPLSLKSKRMARLRAQDERDVPGIWRRS